MKYNFFEWRDKIKADPSIRLPDDINKPVVDWLDSIGCEVGKGVVESAQEKVQYMGVEIVHDDQPGAKISFQIDMGMIGERRIYKTIKDGPWTVHTYKTIKNWNIDKRKPK